MHRVTVSWCVGAVMLAVASTAHAEPAVHSHQTFDVRTVRFATRGTVGTFSVKVRALVNDESGHESFVDSLLHDTTELEVTDGHGRQMTLPLTGCRSGNAGRVVCVDSATRTFAVAVPLVSGPSAYILRVSARRVAGDALSATPPLTVTLDAPAAARRIDVTADCRPNAGGGLTCHAPKRPNIILIMTDDQRPDTVPFMPQLISLIAQHGVTFTNSFVTTLNCCPSRVSTLNGLYVQNHGVLDDAPPLGGAPRFVGGDRSTVATWLQAVGYRTGMYGKYLLSYNLQNPPRTETAYIPPGWDEWHVFVQQGYFNYKLVENGAISAYGDAESDYSTDVLFAKAIDFVTRPSSQPFFLHLATSAPHSDGALWPVPAPRHQNAFRELTVPTPPSYDEEDVADKPLWVRLLPRGADQVGQSFFTHASWNAVTVQRQLQALLAVDEGVGRLVSALEASGQAASTVIIYTSDNGLCWEEHRWLGKGCPYEECLRVPLLIRDPRLVHGARQEPAIALNIDLAPTIAALAGTTPPAPVDGRSLVPFLMGGTPEWRTDFLFEYFTAGSAKLGTFVGVRGPHWKYVEYDSPEEGAELYDLTTDPYELKNLAGDPAYGPVVNLLRTRLTELSSSP